MTEDHPGLAPLTVPPPSVDASTAARIAERAFGVDGTVSELGGERDRNFRVDTDDGAYVLKVTNPVEDADTVEFRVQALEHVAERALDLPVMRNVQTTGGDPWTTVEDRGETCYVRLLTHVPGRNVSAPELDRPALNAYGETVARMGRALRGFFHPAARYDVAWDLRHAPGLRSLLDYVEDGSRRAVAERVLDRFDERVAPAFEDLRAQVVHNDLTLGNVLFGEDDRVSGIVDFGDLTHTALVCDLAVAVASTMARSDAPVETARAVIAGYAGVTPLEDEEAELLGDLVAARLAAWGLIVAWQTERSDDDVAHIADGVDTGWKLLRTIDDQGLDAFGRRLRSAALATNAPYDPMATDDLLERRREVLASSPLTYREPVHFVDGEGPWLFDSDGRRYLDAYNNVQVLGHADPDVASAIGGQARTLATNSRYLHESLVELSERLVGTLPDPLDTVLVVNSGSEAVELAWRMAQAATGEEGAVATEHAYHGVTDATTDLSPEVWPEGYRPDHVETIPAPVGDARTSGRGADGHDGPPTGGGPSGDPASETVDSASGTVDPAAATAAAVDALDERGVGLAAVFYDPLFTSDGIRPADPDELAAVVDRVREGGGVVVADEVQAGHGRTGSDMWSFEATGVVPDVVAMGKPMGNGHPVAAVVARSEVFASLMDRTSVFSTFGGNPVSCTAALAVLDAIEERDLIDHAADVGEYLRSGLAELAEDHDLVGDVRGRGMLAGVELVADRDPWTPAPEATADVMNGLRRRRVLVSYTGRHGNVLKIRPPLAFERRHADRLFEELDDVLSDVAD